MRADGDHLGLLRLLLGGVRNDDAPPNLLFLLNALHQDPIVQRTDIHGVYLLVCLSNTNRGLGFTTASLLALAVVDC
jgi:hypothetical protein